MMIDFYRPEIVTAIKDQARKHDGPEGLGEKLTRLFADLFKFPNELKEAVLEGFEPETTAFDIIDTNLIPLLRNICSNEGPDLDFGNKVSLAFKRILKECINEVSEGLCDEKNSFFNFMIHQLVKLFTNATGEKEEAEKFVKTLWM